MTKNRSNLRSMVEVMRIMTRYAGFIARPLVAAYAAREVISCGLRGPDGSVRVIFTPRDDRKNHRVVRRDNDGTSQPMATEVVEPFSDPAVQQYLVPEARLGDTLIVLADQEGRRQPVSSPDIVVKHESPRDAGLLGMATSRVSGCLELRWPDAFRYDAMLFFLAVECDQRTASGIYTRELSWRYPRSRGASLTVTPPAPPVRVGHGYHASLVIVDYNGWVSAIGSATLDG